MIGRAGRPVAVLIAYTEDPTPRTFGGWEGRVEIAEDFDAPLPAEILDGFSRHPS